MSSNIALPTLPNWVQQRLTALYSAKTTADFDSAFDAFVSNDVSITVNGKHTSREQYKKMVQGEITGDVGADVSFNGVVSVPTDDKDLSAIGTGIVGVFFQAVVFGKFFVFGARQSSTVASSLNVVVRQDQSLHHHQVGRGGDFDARRATVLDLVFTDEPEKIVLPNLPPTTGSA